MRCLRFVCTVVVLIAVSGCGQRAGSGDGRQQIAGVLFQEDQFFRLVEAGMRQAAEEANVHLVVNNSRNRPDEELRLIDTYVVRGVSAIVISPLKSKASVAALQRAHEKGIKIITYNTPLAADFPVCYVESNQVELGATTGKACREYVREKLGGKANVALIAFVSLDPESAGARVKGFRQELAQLPGATIVTQQDAWLPTKAANVVSGILTAHPEVDIVWSANEGGTVGAVAAVRAAGKAGKVVVFGTDISRQLGDYLLADDDILQTVTAQKPLRIGSLAVQAAVDALAGKPVEKKVSLPGVLFTRRRPEEIRAYLAELDQLGDK